MKQNHLTPGRIYIWRRAGWKARVKLLRAPYGAVPMTWCDETSRPETFPGAENANALCDILLLDTRKEIVCRADELVEDV